MKAVYKSMPIVAGSGLVFSAVLGTGIGLLYGSLALAISITLINGGILEAVRYALDRKFA